MAVRNIITGIYAVGSIDWYRRLFDELIPLPDGMSYNSYLIKGSKKIASVIGSFGWSGRMLEQIKGMITNLKVEFIEPVIIKGYPREEDFKSLDRLADEILQKHMEHNIIK
jgi:flavorubredoxin